MFVQLKSSAYYVAHARRFLSQGYIIELEFLFLFLLDARRRFSAYDRWFIHERWFGQWLLEMSDRIVFESHAE